MQTACWFVAYDFKLFMLTTAKEAVGIWFAHLSNYDIFCQSEANCSRMHHLRFRTLSDNSRKHFCTSMNSSSFNSVSSFPLSPRILCLQFSAASVAIPVSKAFWHGYDMPTLCQTNVYLFFIFQLSLQKLTYCRGIARNLTKGLCRLIFCELLSSSSCWSNGSVSPRHHCGIDHSMVFARWRHCPFYLIRGFVHGPTRARHLDRFIRFCRAHGSYQETTRRLRQ